MKYIIDLTLFQAITLRVLTVIDAVGSLPLFTDRIEPLPAAIQALSILYKATLIKSKRDMILPWGMFPFVIVFFLDLKISKSMILLNRFEIFLRFIFLFYVVFCFKFCLKL